MYEKYYTEKNKHFLLFYKLLRRLRRRCDEVCVCVCLVDFHIWVDFTYKETRSYVAHRTANNSKRSAKQCHVPKVKCGLKQTVHSAERKWKL